MYQFIFPKDKELIFELKVFNTSLTSGKTAFIQVWSQEFALVLTRNLHNWIAEKKISYIHDE